jgi:hypothetical protein
MCRPVSLAIRCIFFSCAPSQIREAVIRAFSVVVATFHSIGARSDVPEQYELVNQSSFFDAAFAKNHRQIASGR